MGTIDARRPVVPTTVRTGLWLAGFVLACLLGRITVVEPFHVGLVWPAAGVGLVWLAATRTRRDLVVAGVLVAVSSAVVLALTGSDLTQSLLALLFPLQPLVTLHLLRRWVPHLWGAGGRAMMGSLTEFGLVLAAAAIGAASLALLRSGIGVLVSDEVFSMVLGRWARNATAMATVGLVGLLLGGWIAERRDRQQPVLARPRVGDLATAAGIVVAAALIFVFGFAMHPDAPTAYMLTLTVVAAAVRFNPVLAALHGLLTGAVTVWLTIVGIGPIATVENPETRAVLAQLFVVVLMTTGMAISMSRMQVLRTVGRLEASEALLGVKAAEQDMMLSKLGDGLAIVEEGGHYLRSNDALRAIMTGQRHSDAFTGDVPPPAAYHLHHPDGRPLETSDYPYLRALAGQEVVAEQYHVRRPPASGHSVIEISAYTLPPEPDTPRRALVVVRDVTAAVTHRESLVAFAGTVAHDLNNPLSVIDGWAEALEDDLDASDADVAMSGRPMVRHIRSSVDQMRTFIGDLLAHAVARDQTLQCEQIVLRNLVKHVANGREQPGSGVVIDTGELADVWADRVLLRQVLDNLVGNGIKYVAPGTEPHLRIESEPAGEGWTRVLVRDNGIGIDPTERDRVFDRFTRLTAANYQGTGLGLAICKRVVERHGGTIEITDNPDGVGSCFAFTLPTTSTAYLRATAG